MFFLLLLIPIVLASSTCYDIKASDWWAKRKTMMKEVARADSLCSLFQNNPMACVNNTIPGPRSWFIAHRKLSPEDASAARCAYLASGSSKCISNPCVFLNNGNCTLQNTAGLCIWYTRDQARMFNKSIGCYRNPCHMFGKFNSGDCYRRGIPGLYNCTYCSGKNDPVLASEKMGCQIDNVLTTSAECKTINPDARIGKNWIKKGDDHCQCYTVGSRFCQSP